MSEYTPPRTFNIQKDILFTQVFYWCLEKDIFVMFCVNIPSHFLITVLLIFKGKLMQIWKSNLVSTTLLIIRNKYFYVLFYVSVPFELLTIQGGQWFSKSLNCSEILCGPGKVLQNYCFFYCVLEIFLNFLISGFILFFETFLIFRHLV